jgi:hypothetical protein
MKVKDAMIKLIIVEISPGRPVGMLGEPKPDRRLPKILVAVKPAYIIPTEKIIEATGVVHSTSLGVMFSGRNTVTSPTIASINRATASNLYSEPRGPSCGMSESTFPPGSIIREGGTP